MVQREHRLGVAIGHVGRIVRVQDPSAGQRRHDDNRTRWRHDDHRTRWCHHDHRAPGGATTTTVAGGATTTTSTVPVVVGPATVLVPATQLTGNWTSPTFNIAGGTWNIGWAFACDPVPAQTPTFAVFVVNAGASPGTTPAVTSTAPSGQSVTPQTTTGSQQIVVQSPAGCRWVVKVTGSSS